MFTLSSECGGPSREWRKGFYRRDKGWENHLERTPKGRTSSSLGGEKPGRSFVTLKERDNLERARELLISCRRTLGEAAWRTRRGGRCDLSSQWLEKTAFVRDRLSSR